MRKLVSFLLLPYYLSQKSSIEMITCGQYYHLDQVVKIIQFNLLSSKSNTIFRLTAI